MEVKIMNKGSQSGIEEIPEERQQKPKPKGKQTVYKVVAISKGQKGEGFMSIQI